MSSPMTAHPDNLNAWDFHHVQRIARKHPGVTIRPYHKSYFSSRGFSMYDGRFAANLYNALGRAHVNALIYAAECRRAHDIPTARKWLAYARSFRLMP